MSDIYRLAKPRQKGLFGLLFSRFFVIVLLLLVQIFLVISFYTWLQDLLPFFSVITVLFTIGGVIYLFNCDMDSSAKLTWMFVISLVPITGAALLAFTQTNLGHRTVQRRVAELIAETQKAIPQAPETMAKLEGDPYATDDLSTFMNRSGCFPVFENTEVTYFPLGEDKFAAMLEELRKAEKFIFMEYFIIDEGYMWGSILRILEEKAKAGVDVRVMYDGMCEIALLPSNYCELLEQHGIKAKAFAPIRPIVSSHYNYRDHRKILVIDGKVAFNGGINLGDEYINRVEHFGHWKDTAVMLKGDAARGFALMFLQMWNITEEHAMFEPWIKETGYAPERPSGFVIPFGDCPLDEDKVGRAVYMDILNRATDYVHIMTPYLILDDELKTALIYAAQRGVDVRLILPGIPDKKLAFALAKSHYKRLVSAGIKIYEYTPGFVHSKIFVADDTLCTVGTINLDYRSLYLHFENGAYLYGSKKIATVKNDLISMMEEGHELTLAECENGPVTEFLLSVLRLFAPLM